MSTIITNSTSGTVNAFVSGDNRDIQPNQSSSWGCSQYGCHYGLNTPQNIVHYSNGAENYFGINCNYNVVTEDGNNYKLLLRTDTSGSSCDVADGTWSPQ